MKKIIFVLAILLLSTQTAQSNASTFQSISSIQEATRHYIASNLSSLTDYKLTTGKIDSRLKLPLCAEPLTVFTQIGSIKAGRNAIGIKCNSNKKWTIYTSAMINIYKDVIVLSRPIQRGEFYSNDFLRFEKRDIAGLRSGFFTNMKDIVNKQATRNLSFGAVITKSNITEPKLIKRGEKVTIKLRSQNLEISTAGIALMDGIRNQNIKIKNIKSRQIVQATVVKQGQVVISF